MARTECEAERLTAEDARILKLERGTIAGHGCSVMIVDPPPDGERPTLDALRAHLAGRLDQVPRCRQRLAPTPLGVAPPLWVDDVDFDVTSYRDRELLLFGLAARLRPWVHRRDQRGAKPDWRRAPAEATRLMAAVRRELFPSSDLSPLAVRVGPSRTVGWLSGPLAELHDAGKAVGPGVTVNDLVLAVVAGGIRSWLSARHAKTEHIRVKVPVSLHRPGELSDQLGNRDSFIFVDLPIDEPEIREQLIAISRETSERKEGRDAVQLDALIREVEHLPLGDHAVDLTMSPRVFALNVSNVPGPPGPLYVMGGRVVAIHGVIEVAQGHALRFGARSGIGQLSFGLCADPGVVPDLDLIIDGMQHSIDDLVALARR